MQRRSYRANRARVTRWKVVSYGPGIHNQLPAGRSDPAGEFVIYMGGDLGGTEGTVPPKIRFGRTAHASVSPIFGEAVLMNACESTN